MGSWLSLDALCPSSTRLPTTSRSSSLEIRPEKKGMATDTAQPLRREAQRGIRGDTKGGYAPRASTKDRQGYWRCVAEEIQQRQAELSGRLEVYAARGIEASGEYADALGVFEGGEGVVSCQRLLDDGERDTKGYRACFSCSVGYDVGVHEEGEER